MRRIPFTKMHGAGNDFVVVDCMRGDPVEDWTRFARQVLDRHFGVGGDTLLLVQPSTVADFRMGMRNADGSEPEICGNGIRCFFKFVRERGYADHDAVRVETLAGVVTPRWLGGDRIEIEMTRPILDPQKIPTRLQGAVPLVEVPLAVEGEALRVTPVSMGNPHCVIFVDDPERAPVERLGPAIEHHPDFPARTNVEFVAIRTRSELVQRTWERGIGETLACGSGACAATVAARLAGRADEDVRIQLRGGELRVRWPDPDGPIYLSGPATHVFDGEIQIP
jgi:diaminopimelate epimerase